MLTRTRSNPEFPLDSNAYKLVSKIGAGVSSTVYKAICIPMSSAVVAIKAIDLDQCWANFGESVIQETKTMFLLSHPNILNAYCSFTVERVLWVVMPLMSCGSLRSIVSSSFPNGLPESEICVLLLETLKAISYLHDHNHVHLDIKTGNILVDSDGSVKLADFGVSATIYEQVTSSGTTSSSLKMTDMMGTTYWMAPEVVEFHTGYGFKSDIWAFGVTALELAQGRPPFSHYGTSTSTGKGKDEFSQMFRDMVALCLEQDPSKRPSAEELLQHPFFKNCKGVDVSLLRGLPDVEQMFRESRNKNCSADQDEEIVNNKKIIGWKFCEDDLELSPVFLSDSKTSMSGLDNLKAAGKQIRGETATELEVDDGFSSENLTMASTELDLEAGFPCQLPEDSRNVLLQTLTQMRKSLGDQMARVSEIIVFLGGEVVMDEEKSREEELVKMVENLKIELEAEKRKNLQQ